MLTLVLFLEFPIGDKNVTHFLAFIIANKQTKEIVISFRGSDFEDLGSQLSSSNKGILVSEGFFTTWQLFQSSNFTRELASLIKKYPSFTVSSTGHSLEGALGLYQALDVKQNHPQNTKVCFYGFNIPRGGNDLFANYVDKELDCINHVVSGGDLVSRVPPCPIWVQPKGEV
ncbi:9426_t:CDS:2 [Cetraspora pellucida]|uniref:9426_t:CDS:1 n=1 Tax=Cetraspora pellucida TaxID=1433469 RepID=A0A9N9GVV3_9GLOM|nr:9426_t:CDS:2 [Cetraspora pellucida]